MINAVIATLLFAVSATCGNRSARLVGGMEANFWRLTLAVLLLGVWSLNFGVGISGVAFWVFIVSGIAGIGVGDFGLFQAFPRLGARLTMLLTLCLTAPIGAFMEWVWLGSKLSLAEAGFSMMTISGVVITLWPDRKAALPRGHVLSGVLFALLAAGGGAVGAVLSRRAYELCRLAGEPVDGPSAAFQRVMGGVVVTGLVFAILRSRQIHHRIEPVRAEFASAREKWKRLWPWVTGNALSGITIGVSFMQRSLETTEAGIVLAIVATTPIAVIPLARIVEGDRITRKAMAGSVVAVTGAVMLAWAKHA